MLKEDLIIPSQQEAFIILNRIFQLAGLVFLLAGCMSIKKPVILVGNYTETYLARSGRLDHSAHIQWH